MQGRHDPAGRSALRSVEPPQASVASNPVHIHWGPVGLSPGLNELQIPGFTSPMRLTRSGRLIRLVVPRDPSASPTSPAKWWCKWWCIYRASSPRSLWWPPFSKAVQRTPSPFLNVFGLFPPPRGCEEIRALGPQSRRYQLRGGGALLLVVDQAGGKYCLGQVISLVLDYTVALGH